MEKVEELNDEVLNKMIDVFLDNVHDLTIENTFREIHELFIDSSVMTEKEIEISFVEFLANTRDIQNALVEMLVDMKIDNITDAINEGEFDKRPCRRPKKPRK